MILSFSLLFSISAQAEWGLLFHRAGFFGHWGLGAAYEFSDRNAVEAVLGSYNIEHQDRYQMNLVYRYSHWQVVVTDYHWRPFQAGLFAAYSLDQDRYFMSSPGKYPSPGYYDETALRWGVEFATTFSWVQSGVGIAYHFRILDSGLIAIYNNKNRDLQYYISSGLSLQYFF